MYPEIYNPIHSILTKEDSKLFELLFEGSFEGLRELNPWKSYFDAYAAFLTPFRRENLFTLIKGISYNTLNFSDFEKKYKNHSDKRLINETIDNVLSSKSLIGVLSVAQFVLTKIEGNEVVTHKDIIMIEILRELNDYDIKNFLFTYEHEDLRGLSDDSVREKIKTKGKDILSLELSRIKFTNLYLIDTANYWGMSGENLAYNSTAKDLYDFLMERNINKIIEYYQN